MQKLRDKFDQLEIKRGSNGRAPASHIEPFNPTAKTLAQMEGK